MPDHEGNKIKNQITSEYGPVPQTDAYYCNKGIKWVVIGDSNYGKGSSCEHAALEPHYLGGLAIVTQFFACIHETNLKNDKVDILGLETFAPGKNLTLVAKHAGGSKDEISLAHSFNKSQVEWFKAGSALDLLCAGCTPAGSGLHVCLEAGETSAVRRADVLVLLEELDGMLVVVLLEGLLHSFCSTCSMSVPTLSLVQRDDGRRAWYESKTASALVILCWDIDNLLLHFTSDLDAMLKEEVSVALGSMFVSNLRVWHTLSIMHFASLSLDFPVFSVEDQA
ncbi:Aconitase/3-isopropylmalate dehydratase [Suillus subaureus]|uniref:Aconitate hydratase, mitochondrial n=1 Tax=Suillus subaureus TaxID=48587 RepID=A0A9P7EC46_9AGAM|nr:Aconitase/3-isopropylmalate dehydratase [Suillus subaureus]KAG1817562.1 Aconitase/3-isopropylmalate dehydratase [Suillus subaureus]